MGPVDFATFVDKLATVAGEAIRPFFRTTLGVQNKSSGGVFDPVTEADQLVRAIRQQGGTRGASAC